MCPLSRRDLKSVLPWGPTWNGWKMWVDWECFDVHGKPCGVLQDTRERNLGRGRPNLEGFGNKGLGTGQVTCAQERDNR